MLKMCHQNFEFCACLSFSNFNNKSYVPVSQIPVQYERTCTWEIEKESYDVPFVVLVSPIPVQYERTCTWEIEKESYDVPFLVLVSPIPVQYERTCTWEIEKESYDVPFLVLVSQIPVQYERTCTWETEKECRIQGISLMFQFHRSLSSMSVLVPGKLRRNVEYRETISWNKFQDGFPNLCIQDVHYMAGKDGKKMCFYSFTQSCCLFL